MNDSTPTPPTCPRCHAVLPPNAPEGLCPRCLAALPLGTETAFTADFKSPASSPLPPEEIAPHFPQLEILECLGRGGMGVVYKARQKSLNRLVALKLLAPERADDPQFAARFEKEAQALAALNHPNIVGVHDFGQAGGFYYLLMEFVDGLNLRQLLQSRRLTPKEALGIVPPVCDALQFAHEHGIVHRDIKPENLLLDKAGRVKIADFGIAKIIAATPNEHDATEASASTSPATLTVGTPAYAAPEQREANGEADHRADIYSLGVVLYEMLTGERPKDHIEPPSQRVQIDVRLDAIVLRALEKTPELRFQTASEFRTQVETVVQSDGDRREKNTETAALNAVRSWLAIIDSGAYAASWDAGSAWFQGAITQEKWTTELQKVRQPLGAVHSRETLDTAFLEGGSRLRVRFKTAFAGMPETTETVLFMRERNGEWKATGYLIRPAGFLGQFSGPAMAGALCAVASFLASPLLFWVATHDAELQRHDFWRQVLRPLGYAFSVATIPATALGWLAVVQIRRSAGKVRGMALAVFAGLFPFLWIANQSILSLLRWLAWQGVAHWNEVSPATLPGWVARSAFQFLRPFSFNAYVLEIAMLALDWFILRRVWRAMNRYPQSSSTNESANIRDTPLATTAYVFAWASGALAAITWMLMPSPPVVLLSSILLTAVAGLTLAIPTRHTPRGRWSLWFCAGTMLMWILTFTFLFITHDVRHSETANPSRLDTLQSRIASDSARPVSASPDSLAQPPQLRFLGWQELDEGRTPPWTKTWHPDGSPVTETKEIALMKALLPPRAGLSQDNGRWPRIVHIWFSHPNFDRTTFGEPSFLDEKGQPLRDVDRSYGRSVEKATPATGNLGWVVCSLSPGWGNDIPSRVTVRLNYTIGPLENTQQIEPAFDGGRALEGGSQLSGLGQNSDGRAYITIAVDSAHLPRRMFGAQAVTKDGRYLNPNGGSSHRSTLSVETFQFDVPLAYVAHFIIGTRPIRTQEWKDVVLPPWTADPADAQVAAQLAQQAWTLWQSGKPGEALPKFQQSIALDPKVANTWNGFGWANLNTGKADEAEKAFRKVLDLEPAHPAALNGLGQICLARRAYGEAEKLFLQAADHGATAAWFGLSRLYLLQGKYEDAQKWAQMLSDAGQGGDPISTKMLEAAKAKNLPEGLRRMIEPPAPK